MRQLLGRRPIVALLTSQVVSSFGTQMTFLARPVFVLVAAGQLLATLPFLAVAFRSGEPVAEPA